MFRPKYNILYKVLLEFYIFCLPENKICNHLALNTVDKTWLLALSVSFALLFIHSWRENNQIHTFSKGVCAMWNANNLDQDLNLGHSVHFLCQ